MHTYIIAEAGVNHNGDLHLARRMIDMAAEAGADAIKFQTFVPELVISKSTSKAPYQKETTGDAGSMLEMVRPLQLNEAAHRILFGDCQKKGIAFLSTPYDLPSIALLYRLGVDTMKIPSAEITNLPYLRAIGALGLRVILSTGMSEMREIETAIKVLIDMGTSKEHITLMQCHTDYPTRMEDANVRAMATLRDAFDLPVGYSDHTVGTEVSLAAVALGAIMIEKHFTSDRSLVGPDHSASLEPAELKMLVSKIRNIEKALGDGVKRPTAREQENMKVMRKSIVAARAILKGELYSETNLLVKRPGTGISPMRWDELMGHPASRDYNEDELIEI